MAKLERKAKRMSVAVKRSASFGAEKAVAMVASQSKEERAQAKAKAKKERAAHTMAKHGARINSKHAQGGRRIHEALQQNDLWFNQETMRINEVSGVCVFSLIQHLP